MHGRQRNNHSFGCSSTAEEGALRRQRWIWDEPVSALTIETLSLSLVKQSDTGEELGWPGMNRLQTPYKAEMTQRDVQARKQD